MRRGDIYTSREFMWRAVRWIMRARMPIAPVRDSFAIK
jgi:hypothetical protein